MLGLYSCQVDYTAAFVQAPMPEDEVVYVEMPRGFKVPGKVLILKRSLYGLKQSPRNFFLHLKGKLEAAGFKQHKGDPCFFSTYTVICLVYVDDCLFFSPSESHV